MLYLDRKINEVINIEQNTTGATLEVVVLGVRRRWNRTANEYEHVVKLGFVDDAKEFTFLRKEVKMRQDGADSPNPYYKDNIPTPYRTSVEPAQKELDFDANDKV